MDEGFCVKCGKRVTVPTTRNECEDSPECGPFRQEEWIPDEVLDGSERRWWPPAAIDAAQPS